MDIRKLNKAKDKIGKLKFSIRRFLAFMGNPADGTVAVFGRPGWIYVHTSTGSVLVVKNKRLPNIYKLPVFVGEDPTEPNVLQVLSGVETDVIVPGVLELQTHGQTHSRWSYDTVWVSGEQFLPWLAAPASSGVAVYVHPGVTYTGSGYGEWPGGKIDLEAHIPTTGARWVLLYFDPTTDTVETIVGDVSAETREELDINDIPAAPAGTFPIAAVRVYDGQEEVICSQYNNDIVDLRWSAFGIASDAVEWGDIGGTLSNQTDLQSALDGKSDIGHEHDDRYYTESETDTLLSGKADVEHEHDAADITSGILDGDRLPAMSETKPGAVPPTGTPSGLFLRDLGDWVDPLPGTVIVAANDAPSVWKERAHYVCDGVADQVEINQAIQSLGAAGGVVQLSPGNFYLRYSGSTYPSEGSVKYSVLINKDLGPIVFAGAGWSTVLHVDDSETSVSMIHVAGTSSASRTARTVIKDLKTNTGWSGSRPTIHFAYAENGECYNLYIYEPPVIGIKFVLLSNNGIVDKSLFSCTNGRCGVQLASWRGTVRNCLFYGNPTPATTDSALVSVTCYAGISVQGEDYIISNNVFYRNFTGMDVSGGKCIVIIGNAFYGQYHPSGARAISVSHYASAVTFGAEENLIIGNLIHNARRGVVITSGSTSSAYAYRNTVVGNSFISDDSVTFYNGILETGSYANYNSFINNDFRGVSIPLTIAGANSIASGNTDGTGARIGHTSTQKVGFWGATPVAQPTTSISGASVTLGSSNAITTDTTFDGYTVAQVVKALRTMGLLA